MKGTMMLWRGGLAAIVMAAQAASASVQAAAGPTVEVALQVGGAVYAVTGPGECIFSDASTIYDAPATQWGVRHDSADRDLNFALWRLRPSSPGRGPDMLTLTIVLGGKTYRVNTTKVGDKTAGVRGSGTASFTRNGAGGVFTIDATADTGAKISGRVTCSAFARPEDNG